MKLDMHKTVEVPEGVTIDVTGTTFVVKGPKGEITRSFRAPYVKITNDNGKVDMKVEKGNKSQKVMLHSITAHLKNMVAGVQEPFVYKLKICSGHFPMTAAVKGDELTIKNFIGEAVPRVLKLHKEVDVKLDGEIITVTHIDREKAGQQAAEIEKLCRRPNFDNRIFQDGIYIIEKAGQPLA